ncbi:diguanylate cyclase, partial [Aurantimonas manganoxydans]
VLTLISGGTMLLASGVQERERAAVAQRYRLDHATSAIGAEMYVLTGQARQYVITGDPTHLIVYDREEKALQSLENRTRRISEAGASPEELDLLKQALRWADTLRDEQRAAIEAYGQGQQDRARSIMFGAEYERELDRAERLIERFQYQLDQRTAAAVDAATNVSRVWRLASEVTLGTTALLFLFVLYFLFKRRVLHPVVKLSDVVARLAAQDYDVEPPAYDKIDEIGDMAQAIRVFRENGLERQRLERERSADLAMRDLLARMTQRMQACDTQQGLEEVVQRFMPEIAPALAGRLYLLDHARNMMIAGCSWLSPVHSRIEFAPIGCWALRRGVPHRHAGIEIDVPCEHLDFADGAPADSICLPLTSQRQTLGLLYLEPRDGEDYDPNQTLEIYLKMLAENIGLALANLRLRETLREMAMADPLTGLANRRALDSRFAFEVAETERLGRSFSCVMLDIDHFKRFNDDHGHDAGDAVLRAVGETLTGVTREAGMVFRYGGEEFVLLMPGLDCEQARERGEVVRQAINALTINHEGEVLGPITVSLGLASAPEHCARSRLVQVADAALLEAKAAGRNRIHISVEQDRRLPNR